MPIEKTGTFANVQKVTPDPVKVASVPQKTDPISDTISDSVLEVKPESPSVREIQLMKELEKLKREKSDREKTESTQKSDKESEFADKIKANPELSGIYNEVLDLKKTLNDYKRENKRKSDELMVERFVSQNEDKNGFIKAEEATSHILSIIEKNYDSTGEMMSVEEAADSLEKDLRDVNRKRLARLKNHKDFDEIFGDVLGTKTSNVRDKPQRQEISIRREKSEPKETRNTESDKKYDFKNRDDLLRQILSESRAKNL